MNELDVRCLDAFPEWLRSLPGDARALATLVEEAALPEPVLRQAVVSLNYLFKSIDLIPDGIEDLGFLDDAFVLRVAAAGALGLGAEAVNAQAAEAQAEELQPAEAGAAEAEAAEAGAAEAGAAEAEAAEAEAAEAEAAEAANAGALSRLAADASLIREFLGEDYARLSAHIRGLEGLSVRGRTVDDVLGSPQACTELVAEVRAWAEAFSAPTFSRDEKNLVKLRSFMHAKLPE